jgi:hypothetical protein
VLLQQQARIGTPVAAPLRTVHHYVVPTYPRPSSTTSVYYETASLPSVPVTIEYRVRSPCRAHVRRISFAVCVSDEAILEANLLASPCLTDGSSHEVFLARDCPSAADGLNEGLRKARHDVIVFVHQDVQLPAGWDEHFWQQYDLAKQQFGNVGVVGVYGVAYRDGRVIRMGHVVDRGRLLREEPALPALVDTLDELLLAVPRETVLSFDPQLGFHLYGADLCLEACKRGLVSVAIDAVCAHNSPHIGLPAAFTESARVFAAKWKEALPVATSCVLIEPSGRMTLT